MLILPLSLFLTSTPYTPPASFTCPDLPLSANETYALVSAVCPSELRGACETVEATITKCVVDRKGRVVTRQGAQVGVDEATFVSAPSDRMNKLGKSLGTKLLLLTETHGTPSAPVALVRLVDAEKGTLIRAERLLPKGTAVTPATTSLNDALAQLAEKLGRAVEALPGRKKTLGVMRLSEQGDAATKNGLGTLVAAELTTRFSRDFGLTVVERSRLDQVLREFELGQAGVLDPKKAPSLGKMLGADAVVLGSVNAAGASTKVFAQIVDVLTGATLAAESVDFKSADLVALSSDAVALRTKSGATFRSLLVPGWGQIYNHQEVKGYAFLASVLILAAGGAGLEVGGYFAAESYRKAPQGSNFDALATRAETLAIAGAVTFGVMGVVWIANVIDAYANGYTYDSAVKATVGSAGTLLRF